MKIIKLLSCFLVFSAFLFFACKSAPPPPEKTPSASIMFWDVEADTPDRISVNFSLKIDNPFPFTAVAAMGSWQAEINGRNPGKHAGLNLVYPDGDFPIMAGLSVSVPLKLNMDIAALAADGYAPFDDYKINLIIDLVFSSPDVKLRVSGLAEFPGVQAPVFKIISIAILKAELVNTRFRVGLEISNPNPYPVKLSAFAYELYGNGRLWADGSEKNIIDVSGKSSVKGNLYLIMNFINMKRDLLDQIIRLEDVNYRFAGTAQVSVGVEYLPDFLTGFDLSGYSEVLEN